jgi:hypothetical protein
MTGVALPSADGAVCFDGGMANQGTLDEVTPFDCPRCGAGVTERFYGPCETCRIDLRATVTAAARVTATEAYEPKMNVTPNAVALKDD